MSYSDALEVLKRHEANLKKAADDALLDQFAIAAMNALIQKYGPYDFLEERAYKIAHEMKRQKDLAK